MSNQNWNGPEQAPARGGLPLIIGGLVVVAVIVGIALFFLLGGDDETGEPTAPATTSVVTSEAAPSPDASTPAGAPSTADPEPGTPSAEATTEFVPMTADDLPPTVADLELKTRFGQLVYHDPADITREVVVGPFGFEFDENIISMQFEGGPTLHEDGLMCGDMSGSAGCIIAHPSYKTVLIQGTDRDDSLADVTAVAKVLVEHFKQ